MTPGDPDYVEAGTRRLEAFERRASTMTGRTPKNTLFQNRNGAAAMLDQPTETQSPKPLPPPQPGARRVRVPAEITINGEPTAPTSLLDIILYAGSDPTFDVEKFRSLVQIQREEQDRQDARSDRQAELAAEAAFNAAMSDVQRQMIPVRARLENKQTNSVYADYAALDRMLRPIYSEAGFGLSYGEEDSPKPDHVRVTCLVTHTARGGAQTALRSHTRKYHVDMPADGKGARGGDVMSKTHATQSAFTYGQRGLLRLIFNIAVSRDDDGNAAGGAGARAAEPAAPNPGTISPTQAQEIRTLLDQRRVSHRAFLQFIRLPRIEDIGVEHFDRAVTKIKSFGGQS